MQIHRGQNVGINENEILKLSVFPNPASNSVFIDAGDLAGDYTMQIFDQTGRVVSESKGILSNQLVQADVSAFAAGLYTLKMQTANSTATTKLIVE